MKDLGFYQDCISDLKEKKAYFILCDGYDGWSYGFPVNPICFTYEEYKNILEYIKTVYSFDIEETIINHNGWDCILPPEIEIFFGKKVCTFTSFPPFIKFSTEIPSMDDWNRYLFKNKENIQISIDSKKTILEKIKRNQ